MGRLEKLARPMRLFTALDISDDVRAALVELLGKLRPGARFQWSPPENLHVTTKFIGDWPVERVGELCTALGAVARPGAIGIQVNGLGWFPNPHSPRVLFAGIYAGDALANLHRDTDAACAALGIAAETKKYSPHLTLARIRSLEGLVDVRRTIAQLPDTVFGQYEARTFGLYESVAGPGGSEYKKLEEFPLL